MKKTILISLIFIFLGGALGFILTKNYQNNIMGVFNENKTYYFLQEGVYSNYNIMNENTKNLTAKLINEEDGKYYVYLGITRDFENAKKIKDIYSEMGYQIYLKEIGLSDEEFLNNVEQFDLLIKNTDKKNEILTIEEVVLANYEEIIKKQ